MTEQTRYRVWPAPRRSLTAGHGSPPLGPDNVLPPGVAAALQDYERVSIAMTIEIAQGRLPVDNSMFTELDATGRRLNEEVWACIEAARRSAV